VSQIWSPSRRFALQYMSHGHCGVTRIDGDHFHVLNDEALSFCQDGALSRSSGCRHGGASDMMDGRIRAIREALDLEASIKLG